MQANRFGIHTLREVTATISTLKKLVQLFHASFNIVRGKADRRNSMETARRETTHVIIFRILQCCSVILPHSNFNINIFVMNIIIAVSESMNTYMPPHRRCFVPDVFQLLTKSDVRVSLDHLGSHRHDLFEKKTALRGHLVLSVMSCLSARHHHRDLSIASRPFSFAHTILSCCFLAVHAVLYDVFW